MASISYRNNRWQVRVRRKGHPTETRSFGTRQDAERWARGLEADMDRGAYVPLGEAQRTTLGDLIERYLVEVTPSLKGAKEDTIRLRALMRNPLCSYALIALTPTSVAKYRDERLQKVSSGTVIRELAFISAIINHARREWSINIENPVSRVRKPSAPVGRDRVLTAEEEARLIDALRPRGRRSPWLYPLVLLALETAMRRGELLVLRWQDVNLVKRTATLYDTKNGEGRVVPLSSRAVEVLQALPRSISGHVIPMTPFAVYAAFDRATDRAKIDGLRFHDLRHTAITRMAEKLPNLIELAAVSGHKSLRMLQRYYHPRAEDLAYKLG
ncbi:MAG: tyrosine-type recombinase/integrase [Betaproteobacteria bacterium]